MVRRDERRGTLPELLHAEGALIAEFWATDGHCGHDQEENHPRRHHGPATRWQRRFSPFVLRVQVVFWFFDCFSWGRHFPTEQTGHQAQERAGGGRGTPRFSIPPGGVRAARYGTNPKSSKLAVSYFSSTYVKIREYEWTRKNLGSPKTCY